MTQNSEDTPLGRTSTYYGEVNRSRLGLWTATVRSQDFGRFYSPPTFLGLSRDHALRRAARWAHRNERKAGRLGESFEIKVER